MNKELKIRISVDKKTGNVKVISNEFKSLNKNVINASKQTERFSSNLSNLVKAGAGLYALRKAYDILVVSGFSYNKALEQNIAGLTALTVATSSNTTNLGKHINISQKYNLANKEAIATMKELELINSQTPHTLNQTNAIYKAMYVSMKKVGATSSDMINLTKQISIAAGSAGIEFNSLLAGVDGLATGTVLANSDLGRFLNGLGLTNTALKETDDVVGLITTKLKDFSSLNTMGVAMSNLSNSWKQITGTLTESYFDDVKIAANMLSRYLLAMNKNLIESNKKLINTKDIDNVKDLDTRIKSITETLKKYGERYSTISNSKSIAGFVKKEDLQNLQELINKQEELLKLANSKKNKLLNTPKEKLVKENNFDGAYIQNEIQKILDPYQVGLDSINSKWQKHYDTLIANKKSVADVLKAWNEDVLKYANKGQKETTQKDLSMGANEWIKYYETIGNYQNAWLIKNGILSGKFQNLTSIQFSNMASIAKKEYFDKINKEIVNQEEELSSNTQDILDGNYDLTPGQKLDNKYSSIESELSFKLDGKAYDDAYLKLNDWYLKQKLKIESNPIKFDVEIAINQGVLSKTSKALHGMSSNISGMGKEQKKWNKYYDEFSKKSIYTQKDAKEFKEFEAKHTANQIAGYANLASAMSGAFVEGSAEAEAFTKIQQGLAMVSAVIAVLNQGKSDPYTSFARMATMAATVATFLSDAGVSGGIGTVNQKDYTSTINSANYGSSITGASGVRIKDYDNHFDKFIDGLDKASARLEGFGSDGSSVANRISSLQSAINDSLAYQAFAIAESGGVSASTGRSDYSTAYEWLSHLGMVTATEEDISRFSNNNNIAPSVVVNGQRSYSDFYGENNTAIAEQYGVNLYGLGRVVDGVNASNTYTSSMNELSTLLTENIASSLDYSLLSKSELENVIGSFDQEKYNQTLKQINDLAIIAKQHGGDLTPAQQEQLMELYRLPDFVKGQDYEGAIERVKELSTSFVSSIRDITVSIDDMINNTLNATSSIGAVGLSGSAATEYYLKEYNKLQDEFNSFTSDGVLDVSHLDDAKDVYNRLLNTTKSITSSNALSGDALSSMVTSINNSLGKNTDVLYNTNDVLKVNIVATESEDFKNLLSLNATQLATFTGAFSDGVLSKGEVSNLNLTSTQIDLISSAYSGVSNTSMTIEEYLQSLNSPTAFALGGIVTAPTNALIGEAGYSEAVIPLNNTNIMENLEGKGISQVVARLDTLTDITIEQANELKTLRKEVEDQGVA